MGLSNVGLNRRETNRPTFIHKIRSDYLYRNLTYSEGGGYVAEGPFCYLGEPNWP